jgi:hypothetical protein
VKSLSRIPPSLAEPPPRRKPANLLRLYEFLLRADKSSPALLLNTCNGTHIVDPPAK